ncbi:MAG: hypothetical protein RLW62_18085 [Gammaproteobacteria bacterium]
MNGSVTLFTTTKPFDGHNGIIQRNALRSWARLQGGPRIVVFGDEPGTREAADEIGAMHVPEVRCNASQTPLISAMFATAQELTASDCFCYLNADIILFDEFPGAMRDVARAFPAFVMIGRRTDVDLEHEIDFAQSDWESVLRARASRGGQLSAATALDYFAFSRGVFDAIPDFAVGRPAWDAWMVMDTRRRRVPLVDATASVTAIHQNHGYGHVRNGTGVAWEGPEANENRNLARADKPDFMPFLYHVFCATWVLESGRVRRAWGREQLRASARLAWYDSSLHRHTAWLRSVRPRLRRVALRPLALLLVRPAALLASVERANRGRRHGRRGLVTRLSECPVARRIAHHYQRAIEAGCTCAWILSRRPLALLRALGRPYLARKLIRRSYRVLHRQPGIATHEPRGDTQA